jgi:hypothetical protein
MVLAAGASEYDRTDPAKIVSIHKSGRVPRAVQKCVESAPAVSLSRKGRLTAGAREAHGVALTKAYQSFDLEVQSCLTLLRPRSDAPFSFRIASKSTTLCRVHLSIAASGSTSVHVCRGFPTTLPSKPSLELRTGGCAKGEFVAIDTRLREGENVLKV